MTKPKIKGPGGLGQYDLGTATQDVRAATPTPQRQSTPSSKGMGIETYDQAMAQVRGAQRNKRQSSRGGRKGGRKSR